MSEHEMYSEPLSPKYRDLAARTWPTSPEPKVIDFTRGRGWGHDFTFSPIDGGMRGSGHFWFSGSVREGDFLLLPNGDRSTRYRITSLKHHLDPGDLRSFEAEFAPRDAPTTPKETP